MTSALFSSPQSMDNWIRGLLPIGPSLKLTLHFVNFLLAVFCVAALREKTTRQVLYLRGTVQVKGARLQFLSRGNTQPNDAFRALPGTPHWFEVFFLISVGRLHGRCGGPARMTSHHLH